jgi:hypothetical protein
MRVVLVCVIFLIIVIVFLDGIYWLGFVMRIHCVFCEVGTIVKYYLYELQTYGLCCYSDSVQQSWCIPQNYQNLSMCFIVI